MDEKKQFLDFVSNNVGKILNTEDFLQLCHKALVQMYELKPICGGVTEKYSFWPP